MRVIIVGGGIGGLTTALMLHARGIDCEVFEQAEQMRELGVGINTLPHAIKELAGLGLCRGSMPSPSAPMSCSIPIASARRSGASPGIDAGYDVPQFSIHRGRLQGVIHQAVRAGSANPASTPGIGSAHSAGSGRCHRLFL